MTWLNCLFAETLHTNCYKIVNDHHNLSYNTLFQSLLTLRTPTLFNTLRTPRGGGFIEPPPSISVVYQPIWMKFLHNVMYDISFPKNIGLALYDLYDVSYDVIMTF